MSPEVRRRAVARRLVGLTAGCLAAVALFMTLGARGNWEFVVSFRGARLWGLVLVAVAIALATVVFQTITRNRILTPSIMGFDALYVLIETLFVFAIGSQRIAMADPRHIFAIELVLMLVFASLLYRWLFASHARSLHLLLLVGIIFGTLFRSFSSLLQRIIDPTEFMRLQDRLFASFNSIDPSLLTLSSIIVAASALALWRMAPVLDVVALGRDHAMTLGVEHGRVVAISLSLITLLVCVSTALVGPVSFFGLLVANLVYVVMPIARHAVLMPAAAITAVICLVGGQTVLERVFGFDTALSVIIEFVGGIVFILMVLRGAGR